MVNAFPIVAVDISDRKLHLARAIGATHIINSREKDMDSSVRAIVGNDGADVIVDMTGKVELIASGYNLAKPDGRVIMVGVAKREENICIHSLPMHFGKILKGSHGGGCQPHSDIPRYLNLYKHGKLKLDQLITDRCSLHEINQFIDKMRKSKIEGRCLVILEEK
jgi:S-(hydroxymethyl)glutathione dehydrogenase/alcohol dehydrogenase